MMGLQVELLNSQGVVVEDDAPIMFDEPISQAGSAISYDTETGAFTLPENGNYFIQWWVAADGAETNTGMRFSLNINEVEHSSGASPLVTGQVSGSALIPVGDSAVTMNLTNSSGVSITLEDVNTQAGLTIMGIPTSGG